MTVRRYLRALADAAQVRTARYEGEDRYVLPVVAMIGDAVVWPLGAEGPEFVPADELAVVPKGLDGRPVLPDHPMGGRESANQPHILERERYGITFNSEFSDNRLRCEVWLSAAEAERVGGDAVRVLETAQRALAGEEVEPLEISLGVFTSIIPEDGISPRGERYTARWQGISYDHLAVGLNGHEGACSVEMGCGTPRINKRKQRVAPAQLRAADDDSKGAAMAARKGLFGRVLDAVMKPAQGEGVSELWMAIHQALEAVVPQFMGVEEVFPDDGLVVYSARVEDSHAMFQRGYSIDDDGAVSLADDEQRVEPQLSYEPVAASGACQCDGDRGCQPATIPKAAGSDPAATDNEGRSAQKGDPVSKRVKELAGRLIALESAPFGEGDRERLESWPEESLQALVDGHEQLDELEVVEDDTEPDGATEPEPDENTVSLSREEYNDMKAAAAAYTKQQATRKAALVSRVAAAQDSYTEDQLKAKEIEDLEAIAKMLKLDEPAPEPNYAGARVTGDPETRGLERFAAPDAYGLGKRKEAN